MPKNILSRVAKLISSLRESEKAFFVTFTRSTHNRLNSKSKILELYRDLQREDHLNANAAYIKKNRKNYENLEDKILDSLLIDINLKRSGKYLSNPEKHIVLQKESLKSKLLNSRGVSQRAYDLAQTCINQSIQLENFDLTIQLLKDQLSMTTLFDIPQKFAVKLEEMKEYEYKRTVVHKSILLYYELKLRKNLSLHENLDIFLKNSYQTLSTYLNRTASATVRFIQKFFLKELYEANGQLHSAFYTSIKLYDDYDKLTNDTFIYNVYEVVFQHARLSLELNQTEHAAFLFERVIVQLPFTHDNYQKASLLLFIVRFLKCDFINAQHTITQFLALHAQNPGSVPPNIANKWLYFKASLDFQMGHFHDAAHILQESALGKGEKACHKLKYRFLQILVFMELGELDLADNALEALRKFIERHQLQDTSEMLFYEPLYALLNRLKYAGYDFHNFNESDMPEYDRQQFTPLSDSFDLSFPYKWISNKIMKSTVRIHSYFLFDNRINEYYETGVLKSAYSLTYNSR